VRLAAEDAGILAIDVPLAEFGHIDIVVANDAYPLWDEAFRRPRHAHGMDAFHAPRRLPGSMRGDPIRGSIHTGCALSPPGFVERCANRK
jgi:hypothetical protein